MRGTQSGAGIYIGTAGRQPSHGRAIAPVHLILDLITGRISTREIKGLGSANRETGGSNDGRRIGSHARRTGGKGSIRGISRAGRVGGIASVVISGAR